MPEAATRFLRPTFRLPVFQTFNASSTLQLFNSPSFLPSTIYPGIRLDGALSVGRLPYRQPDNNTRRTSGSQAMA